MRVLPLLFVAFGLVLTSAVPRCLAADAAPEAGFTPLFNGKDLTGWQTARVPKSEPLDGKTDAFAGRFKVADGILVYDPAVKGNAYIETTREFSKDVDVKLDFKAGPKCNNDFFLRGTKFDIIPGNKENKDVKEGEWSTLEIVVQGDTVEHKINGVTVRTAKAGQPSSPFMLRAEFGDIQIRNIRVKE